MKTIGADKNYFRILDEEGEYLVWKTIIRGDYAYFYCSDLKKRYRAKLISAKSELESMTIVQTCGKNWGKDGFKEYAIDRDELQEI